MDKIILKFSAQPSCELTLGALVVVLTMDENGKHCSFECQGYIKLLKVENNEQQEEQPVLPKRVLKAFTRHAIDKILSQDEIPNSSGMLVLDGYEYNITIKRGDVEKTYSASDANIGTYPLLRYLASWYGKILI